MNVSKKRFIPFVIALVITGLCFLIFSSQLLLLVFPHWHLYMHEQYLASDELMGRNIGTPGIALAEEYIASKFHENHLAPMPGEINYFQEFRLKTSGYDRGKTLLSFTLADKTITPAAGQDFRPFPWSDEGTVEGELVFAGFGITAKDKGWDDYNNLAVKDKIVLVLRGEPESVFTGSEPAEYSRFKSKIRNAQNHGAKGLLLVTLPFNNEDITNFNFTDRYYLENSAWFKVQTPYPNKAFPSVQLSIPASEKLFINPGKSLEDIAQEIDKGSPLSSFPLHENKTTLVIKKYSPEPEITVRNVAGFVPGNDPELKNEWIVVGAHHDHLGSYEGDGDTIYNGADDNASGTSGVLELAAYFSAHHAELKRSILFITFSAEEWGLYGSEAFMRKTLPENITITAMCNLDMIGRNPGNSLEVIRRKTEPYFSELIDAAETKTGLTVRYYAKVNDYHSDDMNFSKKDIPTFFFFSGTHEDYHGVDDEADRIAYSDLHKRVEFIREVVWLLVNKE